MQRRHRTIHRWIWLLIAVCAIATFVLSLRVRPHYPDVTPIEEAR